MHKAFIQLACQDAEWAKAHGTDREKQLEIPDLGHPFTQGMRCLAMIATARHDARSKDFSPATTGSSERNLICNDPYNGAASARAEHMLEVFGMLQHCTALKEVGCTLLHAISFFLPLDCAIDHAEPGANILGSEIHGFTVVDWNA